VKAVNILSIVAEGKKHRDFFFFSGYEEPFCLRPLTVDESDKSFSIPLGDCRSKKTADLIIRLNLKRIDWSAEVNPEEINYGDLKLFLDEVDYWTAYFGVKEDQPDKFSAINPKTRKPYGYEAIKKIICVHEIADKVREINGLTPEKKETIEYFVKSIDGKYLAKCVWRFNIPITDAAWKATPLQIEFMDQTDPMKKRVKKYKSWRDIDDSKMTIGSYMDPEEIIKRATFFDGPPPKGTFTIEGTTPEDFNKEKLGIPDGETRKLKKNDD